MKVSKQLMSGIIAAAMAGAVETAAADMQMQGMDMTRKMAGQSNAAAITHKGDGVLKAVNTGEGKVQLAHHEIASLHWPAMTMWFDVRGPLPKNLKAGDAVRFELTEAGPAKWVVTKIEPR